MIKKDLFNRIANFEIDCEDLIKVSFVKHLPNGKWRVVSRKGKNLGTFDTEEAAKKHLGEIEFFKHQHADDQNSADDQKIDLTEIDEFAYSAVVRKLKEETTEENLQKFLALFKKEFDSAYKGGEKKPEFLALRKALLKFNKICPIKISPKLIKSAASSELGNAETVGKYLADIIKFTTSKISPEKRPQSLQNLKRKLLLLDEKDIAGKNMPSSASIGSAITFVKHTLFNQNASYVREVLNSIVRHL